MADELYMDLSSSQLAVLADNCTYFDVMRRWDDYKWLRSVVMPYNLGMDGFNAKLVRDVLYYILDTDDTADPFSQRSFEITEDNFYAVLSVADFLGCDSITESLCMCLTPQNSPEFVAHILNYYGSHSSYGRAFVEAVQRFLPTLTSSNILSIMKSKTGHYSAKYLKKKLRDQDRQFYRFWSYHLGGFCNFCDTPFRPSVSYINSVEFFPCCFELVHANCFRAFLRYNIKCPVNCIDILRCVKTHPPRGPFDSDDCPFCGTRYNRGVIDLTSESTIVRDQREALRLSRGVALNASYPAVDHAGYTVSKFIPEEPPVLYKNILRIRNVPSYSWAA